MIVIILISYIYSAPPIRLKTRPPLDSLANAGYVLGPAMLGFSYGGSIISMPPQVFWIAGFVASIHAFSTLTDYETDKKIGDTTFAIEYGKHTAILAPIAFILTLLIFSSIDDKIVRTYFAFALLPLSYVLYDGSEKTAYRCGMTIYYSGIIFAVIFLLNRFYILSVI